MFVHRYRGVYVAFNLGCHALYVHETSKVSKRSERDKMAFDFLRKTFTTEVIKAFGTMSNGES